MAEHIEPTLTAQPPVVQETVEDSRARILFVDDEERILTALRNVFRSQYQVVTETRPVEALKLVQTTSFPVVVSDQRTPDLVGVEFLRQVRDVSPGSVRILLTGYSDLAWSGRSTTARSIASSASLGTRRRFRRWWRRQ
ncbi:MAG: response regulator [Betaproteobacteria bacterium]|nr:response regulator [Betaproteobacteria bacterium]